jgi:hypothetical protein
MLFHSGAPRKRQPDISGTARETLAHDLDHIMQISRVLAPVH